MKLPIRFNTTEYNKYLLTEDKYILPLHPLLDYIIQQMENMGENNYILPEKIVINEKEYSKDDIEYYFKKYLYLKKAGAFSSESDIQVSGRISAHGIEKELANLTQLVFEVTEACNLNCKYCTFGDFYEKRTIREHKYLTFEVAKKIIDFLVLLWNSHLNKTINREITISFYGGEPLLNIKLIKHIIDYIENLNVNNINFRYSMTTNAVLLDKHMDYLVEKKFTLLISLDGNSDNQSYRVDHLNNNSFPKVFNNIKLLQNRHSDYFKKEVNFNSVLHNRNSISDIFSFIEKEFGKQPIIATVNSYGINPENEEDFKQTYKNPLETFYTEENYEELVKATDNRNPNFRGEVIFIHNFSGNIYRNYLDLIATQKRVYIPTGTCYPFKKKMFITANGEILPCERIGHQFALGFINEQTVDLSFECIAQKYNSYYEKFQNQCILCFRKISCPLCLFTMPILKTNPKCNAFFGENKFANYLSKQTLNLENAPEHYKNIMEEITISIN